jgi:hypothetical protein
VPSMLVLRLIKTLISNHNLITELSLVYLSRFRINKLRRTHIEHVVCLVKACFGNLTDQVITSMPTTLWNEKLVIDKKTFINRVVLYES